MLTDQSRKRLMTTKDAAEYLGCSEGWLNNRRCAGGGPPYVRVGRLVRYDPDELADYTRANRRASTSDTGALQSAAA